MFTHDESDTDFPTQNDTTDEDPTQNDEISTETRTEQHTSDSETTCADHTQETQLQPGTQPNLAISPQNSPETGSSHTETLPNSPPTAKFASGPLQRFSEAVSNILTPKTATLPQIPALTDSNPQPTISTHFFATTKILPKKNLPSRNSNTQPPNLPQNLFCSPITKRTKFFTHHLQNQPNLHQNHPILKLTPKMTQKLKNPFQHAKLRAR
jgi:hypothetical protein